MVMQSKPWPAGASTGIGSMPGTDIREAQRTVLGEVPAFPYLCELPGRGPGADMLGRTAALLVDLHVDLQPAGWRLVDRPGMDERRALAWLDEDLDTLEELAADVTGPVKLAIAGPWTLAAGLELPRGDKALSDPGACRDLAESLGEAVAVHVAQVRRRLPGAQIVVQLDEPSLPAVLQGRVPSASGWDRLRPVEEPTAESGLRAAAAALAAAGVPLVVHCCDAAPPVDLLVRAGADAVSIDALLLALDRPGPQDDALGAALESGVSLFAGVVPALPGPGTRLSDVAATVGPVRALWRRLGLAPDLLAGSMVLTPTCGLAGTDPATARAVLAACSAGGQMLRDDPEG